MTTIYYLTNQNYSPPNDLGAADERKAILESPLTPGSYQYPNLPSGLLYTGILGFHQPGIPGDLVPAGTQEYVVRVDVLSGSNNIDQRIWLHHLDADGNGIASHTSEWQGASAGVLTFIMQWDGGAVWESGHRLAVRYQVANTHAMNAATIQVAKGTVQDEMPWVIPADPVYGSFDLDDETDVAWSGTRDSRGSFDLDDETDVEWSGYALVPETSPISFQDHSASRSRAIIRINYIATPSGLTVWVISLTELGISWDPVPEASSYDLERDGSLILQGHEGTEYLDKDLEMNQTYTYRVRSVL